MVKAVQKCKQFCKKMIKKKIISLDVFKHEIELCRSLSHENGGKCCWGKCEQCGVIPLLYKLHNGMLLENPKDIKSVKDKIFRKSRDAE